VSILNFFPEGYTPTSQQSKTLTNIQQAFTSTSVVILNAPTGSGKSFFAKTLAESGTSCSELKLDEIGNYTAFDVDQHGQYDVDDNYPGHGGLVLTITKALQDQYKDLFDCDVLKGKSNYMSTIDSNIDVEIESAVIPKKILKPHRTDHNCPYHNDRRDVLTGMFGALNYKMFMSLPGHVKCRDYIICDEASELEDELVSQGTCTIKYDTLQRAGIGFNKLKSSDTESVYKWLSDLVQNLQEHRTYLQRSLQKKSNWSSGDQVKYRIINQLHSHTTICINNFYESEYIIEKSSEHAIFTPLYVKPLVSDIISYGKKILLMSATIIDHKSYAKSLGITDYKYIEVDSEFDSSKSPIHCSKKYPLSRNTMDKFLPKIIAGVQDIMNHHKNEKGVIHTHTHDITERVYSKIHSPRLLYRSPGISNEDILEQHKSSAEPTVLVSPSLTYGVDLKDELSRFQIIIKLPYLPLHDKRVKRLFDEDPEWYQNKMLNSLVQACGRSTRSADDHSTTYILDGNIIKVMHNCRYKLPNYFIQRFV
jgi:ATP-dependent DNA helicase DinG